MFETSLRFCRRHMHWELSAAQVIAQWSGRIQDQAAVGDQLPTLLHGRRFADQFEVVDVDAENQLQWPIEK